MTGVAQNISNYFKTQTDGIIGTDILFNFVTETNNDAGELRLYPFNTWKPGKSATANDIIGLEAWLFGIPVEVITKRNTTPVSDKYWGRQRPNHAFATEKTSVF